MLLNREALLKKQALKVEKVDLGDGEFVFVRQMTGHERELFESMLIKRVEVNGKPDFEKSLDDFRAKLAVCTLCDADGLLLLQPADVAELSNSMSASRLAWIADAAQGLNRMSAPAQEEDLKNSDAGLADNSSSGSVEN